MHSGYHVRTVLEPTQAMARNRKKNKQGRAARSRLKAEAEPALTDA